jgi:hypothetical protein
LLGQPYRLFDSTVQRNLTVCMCRCRS